MPHPEQGPAGRQRNHQPQPRPARRTRFMVRQHKRPESNRPGPPPPEPLHRQRKNQQKEHIQQRPRRQPVALNPFGAEQGDQAPARRQVPFAFDAPGHRVPAGGGQHGADRGASGGFERELAVAHFHPRLAGARIAGDELGRALRLDRTEFLPRARIEPPDLLGTALDEIAERQRGPILIEPEFAPEFRRGRFFHAHAAHLFLQPERLCRRPCKYRPPPPVGRKGRLGGINRLQAGAFHHPQFRVRLKRHQFRRHQRPRAGGIPDRFLRARAVSGQRGGPRARTHLHLHQSGVIHQARQRAFDLGHLPAVRQGMAEIDLAALAGHGQFHRGRQPHRNAIAEQSIHFHSQLVLVRGRGWRPLQPQPPLAIPARRFHCLPFQGQPQHTDLRRDRQVFGQRPPPETAGQFVTARRQGDSRSRLPAGHGHRLTIDCHLLGPMVRPPRQGDPRAVKHRDLEGEDAAGRPDAQLQHRRPHRQPPRRVIKARRAVRRGHILQHPVLPRLQHRRQRILGRRSGHRQSHRHGGHPGNQAMHSTIDT